MKFKLKPMEAEEEEEDQLLLQSGFELIAKAFEVSKQKSKKKINDLEDQLSALTSQLNSLSNENKILKVENSQLKAENQRIKGQNNKLIGSLESHQSKLQTIKKSILDANSFSQMTINPTNSSFGTNSNANPNSNMQDTAYKRTVASTPLKQDVFHQYNSKGSSSIPIASYTDKNARRKTSPIIINNHCGFNIEEKSRGNLTERVGSSNSAYAIRDGGLSSRSLYDERKDSRQSTPGKKSNRLDIPQARSSFTLNTKGKGNRYERINKFLNECNSKLDPLVFEKILAIFEALKGKSISEDESLRKIKELIPDNRSLLLMLETVF